MTHVYYIKPAEGCLSSSKCSTTVISGLVLLPLPICNSSLRADNHLCLLLPTVASYVMTVAYQVQTNEEGPGSTVPILPTVARAILYWAVTFRSWGQLLPPSWRLLRKSRLRPQISGTPMKGGVTTLLNVMRFWVVDFPRRSYYK